MPSTAVTEAQLANIDCRVCHQERYVKDRKYDCSVCHGLSRPERRGRTAIGDD